MKRSLLIQMLWFFLVMLLLAVSAPLARAGCLTLTIQNLTTTRTFVGSAGAYNVFDPSSYLQTVSFDVNGGSTSVTCNYFLALGASGGTTSARTMALGAKTLNYSAFIDAGGTIPFKDLLTATTSQIITGTFAAGTSNALNHHSFTWTVTPLQIRNATTSYYTDSPSLVLYTGILNILWLQVDSKAMTLQTSVVSSVDLSLVDSGTAFNISDNLQTVDFGNLVSGAAQGFDIVVRSNDGYKVTLTSANKQKMLYQGAYTDTVPYTMTVNGVATDLSSGNAVSPVAVTAATTTASGVVLPVVVTLGTLTGHETSGTYKDIVTVTVSAN